MRPAVNYDHGRPGDRITDSVYFRGYCRTCGDAIRVSRRDNALELDCYDCAMLTRNEPGRQRSGSPPPTHTTGELRAPVRSALR